MLLDPNRKLIGIVSYYIKEHKKHGYDVYHFIDDKIEFDEWVSKGYLVEGDNIPEGHDVDKIIYKLTTSWKILTLGEHNTIISRSLKFIGDGKTRKTEIDPVVFRDEKLKSCLKRWNITNDEGNDVPVTAENIDMLLPEVANAILSGFEEVTEVRDDDLKK